MLTLGTRVLWREHCPLLCLARALHKGAARPRFLWCATGGPLALAWRAAGGDANLRCHCRHLVPLFTAGSWRRFRSNCDYCRDRCTLMAESWKRRQSTLAHVWGMEGYEAQRAPLRASNFRGHRALCRPCAVVRRRSGHAPSSSRRTVRGSGRPRRRSRSRRWTRTSSMKIRRAVAAPTEREVTD